MDEKSVNAIIVLMLRAQSLNGYLDVLRQNKKVKSKVLINGAL